MSLSPRASSKNATPNYADPDLRSDDAGRSSADRGADFSTIRGAAPAASTHSITEADTRMWHRLKVHPAPPEPKRYDTSVVAVNASGIQCAENADTIKVRPDTSEHTQPIHANSIAQLRAADTRYDRTNLTYAAGQSPTKANYKNMLIQGIESGLGTYQLVSTKAHRYGFDSKETTLIELLKREFDNSHQPTIPLDLSDRYQVTDLNKIHDGRDHCQYAMTVYDRTTKQSRTVPLTQAGLRFTDKILQPEKIERAHELMQAHCDFVEQQAHVKNIDFEWKNLMVLSHAGFGRNATVITYCRMAALASQDKKEVHETNLQAQLEQAIATGMASRDPHFVHSLPQASALRVALANKLSRLKSSTPQARSEGHPRSRVWQIFSDQIAAKVAKKESTTQPEMVMPAAPAVAAVPVQAPIGGSAQGATQVATEVATQEAVQAPIQTQPQVPVPASSTSVTSALPMAAAPTNPKPNARQLTERQQSIVHFFSSTDDQDVLNLDKVSKFDARTLEGHHQFIQTLFPIDKQSAFNTTAPVLTAADFLALRDNEHVSKGLSKGFDIMLGFYGLKWQDNKVQIDGDNAARIKACLHPGSHHTLRLSRMIRSMGLFGKSTEARALFTFLKDFCQDHYPAHNSLRHWEDALDAPLVITTAAHRSDVHRTDRHQTDIYQNYPGVLFPNKVLLSDPEAHWPNPNKRALFAKQRAMYDDASARSLNNDTPLKALFSGPELVDAYKNNTHLAKRFIAAKPCDISTHDGFYFSTHSTSNASTSQSDTYEVHVDFANRSLGGGWTHEFCFAQEEVAFIENIGLGRVTHQAGRESQPDGAFELLPGADEGAFRTRLDDGVPTPIMIEGCERVAHLQPYGNEATRLGKAIIDSPHFVAVAAPTPTNWLAIAAADCRSYGWLKKYPGDPDEAWMNKASPADRTAAFRDLFRTAHAGFSMAKKLAGNRPLKLHTGLLGCGVFKNSRTLSITAQLFAAKVTGVDALRFYDVPTGDEQFARIERAVTECTQASNDQQTVEVVLDGVLDKLYPTAGQQ